MHEPIDGYDVTDSSGSSSGNMDDRRSQFQQTKRGEQGAHNGTPLGIDPGVPVGVWAYIASLVVSVTARLDEILQETDQQNVLDSILNGPFPSKNPVGPTTVEAANESSHNGGAIAAEAQRYVQVDMTTVDVV